MNGQIVKKIKPQNVSEYDQIVEGWWEPVDCDYLILFLEGHPIIAIEKDSLSPRLYRVREGHHWKSHDKGFIYHPDFKLTI